MGNCTYDEWRTAFDADSDTEAQFMTDIIVGKVDEHPEIVGADVFASEKNGSNDVWSGILENEDALKSWEKWNNSPEEEKWGQKFSATGKFIKRLIHEIVS